MSPVSTAVAANLVVVLAIIIAASAYVNAGAILNVISGWVQ